MNRLLLLFGNHKFIGAGLKPAQTHLRLLGGQSFFRQAQDRFMLWQFKKEKQGIKALFTPLKNIIRSRKLSWLEQGLQLTPDLK